MTNDYTKPFISNNSDAGSVIKPVVAEDPVVDIDTKKKIIDEIISAGAASSLDMSKLNEFTHISQNRETVYELIDTMAEDPRIAATLEIFAEDATETNDAGNIVWCDAEDSRVLQYVTYLLDSMNVDKNIYKWVYSLCKYGDLYLRLYHRSEFEDKRLLYIDNSSKKNRPLKEDIILRAYKESDNFVHYLEMVPNPAEMFELTKFGKSSAYIHAPIAQNMAKKKSEIDLAYSTYRYLFKRTDVTVYDPTNFVHACLEDNVTRWPEEVDIFLNDNVSDANETVSYQVKRGLSILYNNFKIWRETSLLENSMLLNRLTKSSLMRIYNIQVKDMPKENVGPHVLGIKNLIELKSALNVGLGMEEYTNPGAMENNIYVPVHGDAGTISMEQVGGDVNITGLGDVDYFLNKLYAGLKIPRLFVGDTSEPGGFNGGTSLSLTSSRYAKTVKRIQNTVIQALTDAINLMLMDKGMQNYVNRFSLKMLPPATQEERDRKENLATLLQVISDVQNIIGDIESPATKLKIVNALLTDALNNPEVTKLLTQEVDRMEAAEQESNAVFDEDSGTNIEDNGFSGDINVNVPGRGMSDQGSNFDFDVTPESSVENTTEVVGEMSELPTPEQLGAGDFSDATNPELG